MAAMHPTSAADISLEAFGVIVIFFYASRLAPWGPDISILRKFCSFHSCLSPLKLRAFGTSLISYASTFHAHSPMSEVSLHGP